MQDVGGTLPGHLWGGGGTVVIQFRDTGGNARTDQNEDGPELSRVGIFNYSFANQMFVLMIEVVTYALKLNWHALC